MSYKNPIEEAAYQKSYRKNHKEELASKRKERYAMCPEKLHEINSRSNGKHKYERRVTRQKYYEKNKKQILEYARKYRTEHRSEIIEKLKKYYSENKDIFAGYNLKRHYGITKERYGIMLIEQGGVCAICGGPSNDRGSYHVDHDHRTGIVRGLLCGGCNSGLGFFKDDQSLMKIAIEYLSDRG